MKKLTHLNKPSPVLVLDQINKDNADTIPELLTFEVVEFSNLKAVEGNEGRNSQLDVSLIGTTDKLNSVTVEYWRINLAEMFVGDSMLLPAMSVPENTTELITALNNYHGLALSKDDVIYADFDVSELPVTVTLEAAPKSYGFIGSVELTLTQALDSIIVVRNLNGIILADIPEQTVGELQNLKDGNMYHGTGNKVTTMLTVNNTELELLLGAHRRGGPDAYETPDAEGNYQITLAADRLWSFTFGVGLIDEQRSKSISELYEVTLRVSHGEENVDFELVDHEGGLAWAIPDLGPVIVDNEPAASTSIAHNSQQTKWYAQAFPTATVNEAGANLGEWSFHLLARPIRAVWVPELELRTTVTVVEEIAS